MMRIIVLTTDFGLSDGYAGMMKGVILGIAPQVCLVDLTHAIEPQDVRHAALILAAAAPYFPPGAIHLAVVDPGVGSARRPILVTTEHALYVGPDNGIFTHALSQPAARAWVLDRPGFWRAQVSQTFHGRDIFAPVAAHLANGVAPHRLGQPITDPVRLDWPTPTRNAAGGVDGQIIYADRFGNLISNIPASWIAAGSWRCRVAGREAPLVATYAHVAAGALAGLISSSDTVEIAIRNGNAAQQLGVGVGAAIELSPIVSSLSSRSTCP